MRRVAIVTVLSGALAAGVLAAGPAQAQTKPAENLGKEVTTTSQGALSKKQLISEAQQAGQPVTAKERASIKAAQRCGYYQRTRGRKASNGRWIIAVTNRLTWCWNGSYVTKYRGNFKAYTYNNNKWRWRGWVLKKGTHASNWSNATVYAQGAFYYTGNRKTYKPYVIIRGYKNGAYRWKTGG